MTCSSSLTINQWGECQISQMIDGKDDTLSSAEKSVARRKPWSVVAGCSTPVLQLQEMCSHRELIDMLMAQASSGSRQSTDGNGCWSCVRTHCRQPYMTCCWHLLGFVRAYETSVTVETVRTKLCKHKYLLIYLLTCLLPGSALCAIVCCCHSLAAVQCCTDDYQFLTQHSNTVRFGSWAFCSSASASCNTLPTFLHLSS